MTALIPILLLGTLILTVGCGLLVQWLRTDHSHPVTIEDYSAARAALDSVFVEMAAIKRIFANDDVQFVMESGPLEVQRFFLKERKRLGIQWLRMTQKQVAHLMYLHLKLAGHTYEPSPRFEFNLTAKYACFILVTNGLLVLLWLFGPFETFSGVSHTLDVSKHFCSVFSLRLEEVDPVKLGPPHAITPV